MPTPGDVAGVSCCTVASPRYGVSGFSRTAVRLKADTATLLHTALHRCENRLGCACDSMSQRARREAGTRTPAFKSALTI